MKLSFTEPVCSGGAVLPPPRGHSQLRFLMKVSLVYISMMIATLQLLANSGKGQNLDQLKVTTELNHESLSVLFQQIQRQTNLTFAFIPNEISPYNNVTIPKGTRSVKTTLELAFRETRLEYEQVDSNIIISVGAATPVSAPVGSETYSSLIQGIVKDDEGQVMPGVNIVVKGTTSGTTTDSEGRFVIDARPSDVLVFSFIGYKPQEVEVGSRSAIDIVMESDVEALKEVVVNAGYYQTTDKMKTGSIVRVAAKDIETQPVTSPLMALQGRMPGVDVTPANGVPGSAVKIQVRGTNSLRTSSSGSIDGNLPLYIIDGIPIDSRALEPASNSLLTSGFDPLSTINPANIESIEVLKDADATAIYGSRGANGVVLITTKHGQKAERTNFDIGFYRGVGSVSNNIKMLNTAQYLEMRHEALANDHTEPGSSVFAPDNDLLKWDTTRYTDWQDVLIGGTANITDIQSGISGGNENTSFRFGGGFHKETLVFPGDFGYRKITGNLSVNHLSRNQRFRSSISINYGADENRLFDDPSVLTSAFTLAPNAPKLYDDQGELNWENSTWTNPLAALRRTHDANTTNLIANSNLGYELVKGLSVKMNIGYTDLNGSEFSRYPISAYNPAFKNYFKGSSFDGVNKRRSWIIEPQLIYDREFKNHSVNVVVGSTWQESRYKSQLIGGYGYTSDALLGNINAAQSVAFVRNEEARYRYAAVFARIGYNFNGKYLLNLTGRRDGSSRFGPDKRFANFGAIGGAWIFSNEDFVKNTFGFLSFGKLRASYGTTGNDQIGDYRYFDSYDLAFRKYQNEVGLHPTGLSNPDYAWEVTKKMEVALETGILDNRVSLEVAWYHNRSGNQLVEYTLPYTTGFSSIISNLNARIQNSGFEISIRSENIRTQDFRWSTSLNLSVPKNKLLQFPGIDDSYYSSIYTVGKPLGIKKLYTLTGVNSETGLYEFLDTDSDGAITDKDRQFSQSMDRRYYGGVNNTFSFRGFELSFLFQFSAQKAFNYAPSIPGALGNQPVGVLGRWRNEGDVGNHQLFSQNLYETAAARFDQYVLSSGNVGNSSFVRMKTLFFSYSLGSDFLSQHRIQSAKIYVQGQNLFTITDYTGLDPETGSSLPPLRMICLGFQFRI